MLCPRRDEVPSHFKLPKEDVWDTKGNLETCSFCGSIKPERFFDAIYEGDKVIATDKSYKAYVDIPGHPHSKIYFQHFTKEDQLKLIDLINKKVIKFGYPGYFYVAPFFVKYEETPE